MLSALCTMRSLNVACHAVVGHACLVMAGHTPTHGHLDKGFLGGSLALSDVTVTGLALDLSKNDMTTMGEEHMIRLMVKMFPGDLLFSLQVLSDFFLLGIFCDGFLVALKAGREGWHAGKSLCFKIGVAGEAL